MLGCAADEYDLVKQLGSGNFGVTNLMMHKPTGEFVAVKALKRGPKIDKNVFREVLNHRRLRHPNIIGFKGVFLTPEHLNIAMEYGGGDVLPHAVFTKRAEVVSSLTSLQKAKRFTENDARYFFQQLICGVEYLHQEGITHRDIKLENTLLGGTRPATLVKICDFGYSKSPEAEKSKCKSTVGTPAYLAPEVLEQGVYEGPGVDVWSCGVMLYVMLVGSYPFEDPSDRTNFKKMMEKIRSLDYQLPAKLKLSEAIHDLLSKIFVRDPTKRATISQIKQHPWYLHRLPLELTEGYQGFARYPVSAQPVDEIKRILGTSSDSRSLV